MSAYKREDKVFKEKIARMADELMRQATEMQRLREEQHNKKFRVRVYRACVRFFRRAR